MSGAADPAIPTVRTRFTWNATSRPAPRASVNSQAESGASKRPDREGTRAGPISLTQEAVRGVAGAL